MQRHSKGCECRTRHQHTILASAALFWIVYQASHAQDEIKLPEMKRVRPTPNSLTVVDTLDREIYPVVKEAEVWRCPSSKEGDNSFTEIQGGYHGASKLGADCVAYRKKIRRYCDPGNSGFAMCIGNDLNKDYLHS